MLLLYCVKVLHYDFSFSYIDEAFIRYFLRGCKYSLERTKEKLDFFNSVRAALPEWFDDWDQIKNSMQLLSDG